MTREEKLEAIYKKMANKKRTFGCRCRINDGEDVIFIRQNKTWSYLSIRENEEFTVSLWYTPEIIWHPVMIWDVIKRIKANREISYWEYLVKLLGQLSRPWLWRELELSIEEQSDECIDYVYSLIQKD